LVGVFRIAEAATASRDVGDVRIGSRSDQGSAVAFRNAAADFPVTRGRGQLAQVVGEQIGNSDRTTGYKVLIGGSAVGVAADDGVVCVRQTIGVWVVRI